MGVFGIATPTVRYLGKILYYRSQLGPVCLSVIKNRESETAETVAKAFLHTWIARFSTPSTVTTDRGRQLESGLWQNSCWGLSTSAQLPITPT